MINKVKIGSNMYPFLNDYPNKNSNNGYTWNPIKGKCPHNCKFCYMKVFPQGKLRLDEKSLKDNLGENNFIFVGSSTDMFAEEVPKKWIEKVLITCSCYPKNKYLFQTKNPKRFTEFTDKFPPNIMLGISLESDKPYTKLIKAPPPTHRYIEFIKLKRYKKMVSVEPILDFNLLGLRNFIFLIRPEFVSIGADSKGNNLPEPSKEKIEALIKELEKFTEVKIKSNLKRLMK